MLTHIANEAVSHLRNMYQSGLTLRQADERAEIGNGFDFSLYDFSYGLLHVSYVSFPLALRAENDGVRVHQPQQLFSQLRDALYGAQLRNGLFQFFVFLL